MQKFLKNLVIYTHNILNILWAFLCFYGYFVESSNEFYIAAGLVGLVMGGIQAFLDRLSQISYLEQITLLLFLVFMM